jgi:SAM-dependent methyltransferase
MLGRTHFRPWNDSPSAARRSAFARRCGFGNCEFHLGDTTVGLPFADGSVDVVIAADVIEHLPDVERVLREMRRVLKPDGCVLISTPVADSLFKRLARVANRATVGRLYNAYYTGKQAELDEAGQPTMEVGAGHDHISEMRYKELVDVARRAGLSVRETAPMTVMSGSAWFDKHPYLLGGLFALEAVHTTLRRPTWGHGVCVRLERSSEGEV